MLTPKPSQTSRSSKETTTWKYWFLCWVPALLGLISLMCLWNASQPHLIWFPLMILGYLTIFVLSVILHEMGHFMVAKALGLNPVSVTIGQGPELLNWRPDRVHWQIRAFPFSGFVMATSLGVPGKLLATFAMISAGPAV